MIVFGGTTSFLSSCFNRLLRVSVARFQCWNIFLMFLKSFLKTGTGEDWVYGWLIDTGEGGSKAFWLWSIHPFEYCQWWLIGCDGGANGFNWFNKGWVRESKWPQWFHYCRHNISTKTILISLQKKKTISLYEEPATTLVPMVHPQVGQAQVDHCSFVQNKDIFSTGHSQFSRFDISNTFFGLNIDLYH